MPFLYLFDPRDFGSQEYPWKDSRCFVYSLLPEEVPYLMPSPEKGIPDRSKIQCYDHQGNPYLMISYSREVWITLQSMLLKGYRGGFRPHNLFYHVSLISPPTMSLVYPAYEGDLRHLNERLPDWNSRLLFLEAIYPEIIENLSSWFSQGLYPALNFNSIVYQPRRLNPTGELQGPFQYRYLLTSWNKIYWGPCLRTFEDFRSDDSPSKKEILMTLGKILYQFLTKNLPSVDYGPELNKSEIGRKVLLLLRGDFQLQDIFSSEALISDDWSLVQYCNESDYQNVTGDNPSNFLTFVERLLPETYSAIDFILVCSILCKLLNSRIYLSLAQEYSQTVEAFSVLKLLSPLQIWEKICQSVILLVGMLRNRQVYPSVPFEGIFTILAKLNFYPLTPKETELLGSREKILTSDLIAKIKKKSLQEFFTDPVFCYWSIVKSINFPNLPFKSSAFSIVE